MAEASDREVRRTILRFVGRTPDGEEFSRVVLEQLQDLGFRILWRDFDQHLTYLERAGCLTLRFLHPTLDRARMLTITKRGLDVLEGTERDPGIMAPAEV
jgi:hypothetical protein